MDYGEKCENELYKDKLWEEKCKSELIKIKIDYKKKDDEFFYLRQIKVLQLFLLYSHVKKYRVHTFNFNFAKVYESI